MDKFNQRLNNLSEIHCWKGYHKVGTKKKGGKRINNCVKNENLEETELTSIIDDFVADAIEHLDIDSPPTITLSKDKDMVLKIKAMGCYMPEEHKIWVYTGNRNVADIIRTIAHELVHAKQKEDAGIEKLDGTTGSDHENTANAMAGIMLRIYGKMHPEIYS
jgi:hypothetical protein